MLALRVIISKNIIIKFVGDVANLCNAIDPFDVSSLSITIDVGVDPLTVIASIAIGDGLLV